MEAIKFHCSSFGKLMVGATLENAPTLTEPQLKRLIELDGKEKLTEKQATELTELLIKRDKKIVPTLSKGAKTYIEELFINNKFDCQMKFTNKYTQKGHECEQESIRQVGVFLGYPFATKSPEKFMQNEFLCTSGYDWKTKDFVFDQKNVYEPKGLKLFEDDKEIGIYEWQIRGYAMLLNELENCEIHKGAVIRTLMNPSESIIYQQARIFWKEAGNDWNDEMPEDFINDVREYFNYEAKQPSISDRMLIHSVDCTDGHFKLIEVYCKLGQEYYQSLFDKAIEVNQEEIITFRNK